MWKQQIKSFLVPITALFILSLLLFVVNQIYQIYLIAQAINPVFGTVIGITLTVTFLGLILTPIILYLRLPKAIVWDEKDPDSTRKKLTKRLNRNKVLKAHHISVNNEEELQNAIHFLSEKSDEITKNTASAVFLTTAISQNGKLDALTVLVTQIRMVWKIAHLYHQRPSLRELWMLYTHVGTATFLAAEIEDIDISEQLEPVLRGLIKNSAGKAIPIVGPTATLIMDSLLEGSTNAFLTLRIGILTKKYCVNLEATDHKKARRSTWKEASSLLGGLVVQSSSKVINALLKATKKAGMDSLKSSIGSLRGRVTKMKEGVSKMKDKVSQSSQN